MMSQSPPPKDTLVASMMCFIFLLDFGKIYQLQNYCNFKLQYILINCPNFCGIIHFLF
jgi:hypothetical protein